ncbi:MAG: hypothetical protein KA340_14860 [Saprospiraceae bacterium]|jgi:hypothetical protein|nr:hypothetical protein [Saprospiraceae bacterium]
MLDLSSTASLIQLMAAINLTSSFIKDFKKYIWKELGPLYGFRDKVKGEFEIMEQVNYIGQTSELFVKKIKPLIEIYEEKYKPVDPKTKVKEITKKLEPTFILTGIYCIIILFVFGTQQQLLFNTSTLNIVNTGVDSLPFTAKYTTSAEITLLVIGIILVIYIVIILFRQNSYKKHKSIFLFILISLATLAVVRWLSFPPIQFAEWHKIIDIVILSITALPLLLLYSLTYYTGRKLSKDAKRDFATIKKLNNEISAKNKTDLDDLFS